MTNIGNDDNHMNTVISNLALFGAIALCGCSSVSVKTDYDHAAAFGRYHTYALKPPARGLILSPSSDAALRNALRENLAARGMREVSANERPELAVVPQAFAQQHFTVEQFNDWGYAGGMWSYGYGSYGVWPGAPGYTRVTSYTEGTLLLDFVDTSMQKLVFRGEAKGTLGSAEHNAEKIEAAVKKIVAKLPAATGQYAAQ
jgi:Domain of unknown function (DUF4136)